MRVHFFTDPFFSPHLPKPHLTVFRHFPLFFPSLAPRLVWPLAATENVAGKSCQHLQTTLVGLFFWKNFPLPAHATCCLRSPPHLPTLIMPTLTKPYFIAFLLVSLFFPLETYAQEVCYSVADNDGTSGSPDQLVRVVRATGAETEVGSGLGTSNVEAIAYSPFAGVLYGANAGQFGELDLVTGTFSSIGSGFGTGNGTLGNVSFSDVDGLHFDPYPGELYGVHRRGGSSSNDVMFQIDRTTGAFIPNAYPDYNGDGNGDDYIEIRSGQAVGLWDIDDLAIDPATGIMYGAANNGGNDDDLVQIDRLTGDVTRVGFMGVDDIEGLGFDTNGQLFGSTGTAGGSTANSLYTINKSTGVATLVSALGLNGNNDYEALACLTDGRNFVSGRVYHDDDEDGVLDGGESGPPNVTVFIFRDANGNGQVDSGEAQLGTQLTDSNGDYRFELASTGDFVVNINTGDLPAGSSLTTDNVETASFPAGTFGAEDIRNDFGYTEPPPPPPLGITKSSDVSGLASPGQTVTYTITVTNNGATPQTGIVVTDDFPSSLDYVPNSTEVTLPSTSTATISDTFSSQSFSGNNGSVNWSSPWDELFENGGQAGPTSGDVQVDQDALGTTYALWIDRQSNGASRTADLSSYADATLSFRYRGSGTGAGDELTVQAQSSSGSYQTIATVNGSSSSYQTVNSINLTPYLSSATSVRFVVSDLGGGSRRFWIDDVVITASSSGSSTTPGNAPPTLVTGQTLAAGQQMIITLQGTIPADPSFCVLQNTASVTSNETPTPEEALRIDLIDESSGCELPVELTSFDAVLDGNAAVLHWATASETNNAGFEVQMRQAKHTDWNALAWIDGHGTTEVEQRYQFQITDLEPGRHTFRLKQIDYDGTFEYSPVVEVVVEMAERFVMEPAYPNPFNPEATFRFAVSRSQAVEVAMYDMLGRRVALLWRGEAEAGRMQAVRIDGSGLPSGVYLVRAVGEGFVETQRVSLIK